MKADRTLSDRLVQLSHALRADSLGGLSCAVNGSRLEVIRLGPGHLNLTAQQTNVERLLIEHGAIDVPSRIRGDLDTRRIGITLLHPGSRSTLNGYHVDSTRLLHYRPGSEVDGHVRRSNAWTSLRLPEEWAECISLTSRQPLAKRLGQGCRMLRSDPCKLSELRQAASAISSLSSAGSRPAVADPWLLTNLRNLAGEALSNSDEPRTKEVSHALAHFETARRADRYMRERIQNPISIDQVCIALGVSRRYLEYAFKDALGASPSRYVRLLRLHDVRRRLRNPSSGTKVTVEALAQGFNHLSLFSVQHKKLFGESPSVTLRTSQQPTLSV